MKSTWRRCQIGVLASALFVAMGAQSQADIIPMSQSRGVTAGAWGQDAIGDAQTTIAEWWYFGPMDVTVKATTSPMPNPNSPPPFLEGGTGFGTASQKSSITSTTIAVDSSISTFGSEGSLVGAGSARSNFDLTFQLTELSFVELTGSANWSNSLSPNSTIVFSGPNGEIAALAPIIPSASASLNYAGKLSAGTYRLRARVTAEFFSPQSGSLSLTMNAVAVPEPSTMVMGALALCGALGVAFRRHRK